MGDYESAESRAILQGALDHIQEISASARVFSTAEQKRGALNNIRELIETTFDDYRREIGKVQKAELEELRRQAAELGPR